MISHRGRDYSANEEELLITNYQRMTIYELEDLFRKNGYDRSRKSLNRKIEKLRDLGLIEGRAADVVKRSYKQRTKQPAPTAKSPTDDNGWSKEDSWGEGFPKESGWDDEDNW